MIAVSYDPSAGAFSATVSRETHPVRISPSAIDTWRTCQRKWAYRYIGRLDSPPNASAALGTAVHATIENHVRGVAYIDATPHPYGPTPGQIASQALAYLPPRVLAVEQRFAFRADVYGNIDPAGEVELNGLIDLVGEDEAEGGAFVNDWKTTKDFRYAKTPEVLAQDPQAIIYAAAWEIATGAAYTRGRWTYLHTGLRGARPSRFAISGRRALPMLSNDFRGIVHARRNWTDPTQAPTNLSACKAYGGCAYLQICQGGVPIEALLAQGKFLKDHEKIRKEVTVNMNQIDMNSIFSQVMGGGAPAQGGSAPAQAPAQAPPQYAPPAPTMPATPFPGAPAYAPPQAPPQNAPPQAGSALPPSVFAALNGGAQAPAQAQAPTPAPVQAQGTPSFPYSLTPTAAPVQAAATPAPVQAQAPAAFSPGSRKNGAGFLLYVNAIPIGRDVAYASTMIEKASETLRAQGVAHYKLVDFGKGVGALCQALEPILAQHDPQKPIVLLLDGNGTRDALDTFLSYAGAVVRGV